MSTRLKMSRQGLELLKSFEGLRLTAARLPDGRWTMGHGHTQYAREGATITAEDAEALLLYDLIPVVAAVNEALEVEVTQRQFDALACFAFNVGLEAFRQSEVLTRVNQERMTEAALAMAIWRSGAFGGKPIVLDALVRRRSTEGGMLLDGAPSPAPTPMVTPTVDQSALAALPDTPPAALEIDFTAEVAEVRIVEAPVEPAPGHIEIVIGAPDDVPADTPTPADIPTDVTPAEAAPDTEAEAEAVPETPAVVTEASRAARIYASYPPEPFAPVEAAEPEFEDAVPLNVAPETDPVVTADISEPPLVLILTPPPEVTSEPPAESLQPQEPEAPADHPALFGEAEAQPLEEGLILVEAPPEPEAKAGRWSETAAYFGMGAVGLVAFGAGIAGFQLADASEVPGGFNEKTVIGWVLVLIGVICVWIASYNLFKRLGGSED
ncbi:glycoside hydrolase family protein [Brevundimonas sp.]|uniref:lysozyme n=1 Tax=Brevundimonas sp. TaxID=1871086 RepID=UPI0025EA63C5|nr:glycoside hydrolase family protein [Brevundimonas sp.]